MSTGVLSRPSSYAVRAMVYLAGQAPGRMSASEEIAAGESIPPAFLGKVLHPLCRDRILQSRKGLRGGYQLMVSPERIALLDIVRSVDGEPLRDCLLEDRACSCTTPCELHDSWNGMRGQLMSYLKRVTVADLLKIRESRRCPKNDEPAGKLSRPVRQLRRGD